MRDNVNYALCWDLSNGKESLKTIFESFENLNSKLIYKNLYTFHVLEKPLLEKDFAISIFNKLTNINSINWYVLSFNLSIDPKPRASLLLLIDPLSFLRLCTLGIFRSPFYSITVAAKDTNIEKYDSYKRILKNFINNNRFIKLRSCQISLIAYVSGMWEKKVL